MEVPEEKGISSTYQHLRWQDVERRVAEAPRPSATKRVPAGICGILLGALGVHKFVLGYPLAGGVMLVVSVGSLGYAAPLVALLGIVEGVIYLRTSDDDFVHDYVVSRRPWL